MIRLPTKLTDRMKNVKLILTNTSILRWVRRSITFDRIKTICNAGIVLFTSAHIPRNTLGIELIRDGPYTIDMLRIHLFETFKAMTGFRTVTIEISKDLSFRTELVMMTEKEFEELIFQMLAGISQELKKTLEPTLGPAIEETRQAVWYLTFHPREHLVSSAA